MSNAQTWPGRYAGYIMVQATQILPRILTGLILLPLLAVLFLGGIAADLLCLAVGGIAAFELAIIMRGHKNDLTSVLLIVMILEPSVVIIGAGLVGLSAFATSVSTAGLILAVALVASMAARHKSAVIVSVLLGLTIAAAISLLRLPAGNIWLVLTLATIVLADTAAFFAGSMIGGAKLIPSVSPSKTWAGALFGVAISPVPMLLMAVLAWGNIATMVILGLVVGITSIFGDLIESWFKRKHDIKDSGGLLPGHGGLLDRFDSALIAVPLVYLLIALGWLG